MTTKTYTKLFLSISALWILVNCGGSGDSASHAAGANAQNDTPVTDTYDGDEGEGSNIPYLRAHHSEYGKEDGTKPPVPIKDPARGSIDWIIVAENEQNAEKLAQHIRFMIDRLESGANPRAFDKLFLMEAYMKYNRFYTTTVERSGNRIVVSKNAQTACAYDVIAAHSDAVIADFFGQGNITKDYSSVAESILASSDCDAERDAVGAYIAQRQRKHGR